MEAGDVRIAPREHHHLLMTNTILSPAPFPALERPRSRSTSPRALSRQSHRSFQSKHSTQDQQKLATSPQFPQDQTDSKPSTPPSRPLSRSPRPSHSPRPPAESPNQLRVAVHSANDLPGSPRPKKGKPPIPTRKLHHTKNDPITNALLKARSGDDTFTHTNSNATRPQNTARLERAVGGIGSPLYIPLSPARNKNNALLMSLHLNAIPTEVQDKVKRYGLSPRASSAARAIRSRGNHGASKMLNTFLASPGSMGR